MRKGKQKLLVKLLVRDRSKKNNTDATGDRKEPAPVKTNHSTFLHETNHRRGATVSILSGTEESISMQPERRGRLGLRKFHDRVSGIPKPAGRG